MDNTSNNEIWLLEPSYIAAYTEDKRIMRNIQRSKRRGKRWPIMAEYFKGGRFAVQYKIPRADRQQAEKVFDCKPF